MKKSKVIFLALLACAFGASARTVTQDEATRAARVWAARGTRLGSRVGGLVRDVVEYNTNGLPAFYAVEFSNGGTVFTSADTDNEPILAFAKDTSAKLDADSPLAALLYGRTAKKSAPQVGQEKWRKALSARTIRLSAYSNAFLGASETPIEGIDEIDDVRVAPLVKTKWDQGAVDGEPCYDYYTPTCRVVTCYAGSQTVTNDSAHMVCGCVATAMAQMLKYWKFPQGDRASFTNAYCQSQKGEQYLYYYQGKDDKWHLDSTRSRTTEKTPITLGTEAGAYDWDNMTEVPLVNPPSEENCKAIGKLTYDCGVSVGMHYGISAVGGSGISMDDSYLISDALRGRFDVTNALLNQAASALSSTSVSAARQKTILANLDAGCPVMLLISKGTSGHAVVGDGYGYTGDEKDAYVHLNMGWAGQDDVWYNLPLVNTPESPYAFDTIDGVVYNVFPTNVGEIVSGHVTTNDADGVAYPVAGLVVTATDELGNVYEATTSEYGVYAFLVPAGRSYRIYAELPGELDKKIGEVFTGVISASSGSSVGNSWGNDLKMDYPAVRIGDAAYVSLDRALDEVAEGDIVKVLWPAELRKPSRIAVDCTILATNDNPAASAVTTINEARIAIADGVTVTVTNVVFDVAERVKTFAVEDGCVLKIGGVCWLEAVETYDADNLVVIEPLKSSLFVDCEKAKAEGKTFAKSELSVKQADPFANLMLEYDSTLLGGTAYDNGGVAAFKWLKGAPVPDERAYGRLNGTNFRSLKDLFDVYDPDEDAEIVVFKSTTFENFIKPRAGLVMRGAGMPRPVLTATTQARFLLRDDSSLTVSNLVFTGFHASAKDGGVSFIEVDGGELTLDDGAALDGIVGCVANCSGVVDLFSGTVTMLDGSAIVNCSATGSAGQGGAIYAESKDGLSTLNLLGGTIENCQAKSFGGGVYLSSYYNQDGSFNYVDVSIRGAVVISGNASGNFVKDDVYVFRREELPYFKLTGEAAGSIGIRYSSATQCGNADGDAFMTNAVGAVSQDTLDSFFSDVDDALVATNVNGLLVWTKTVDDGQCDKSVAVALLIDVNGKTNYYESVERAFAYMGTKSPYIVEMLDSDSLESSVAVRAGCDVTLRAVNSACILNRSGDCGFVVPVGASLSLANICISGQYDWYYDDIAKPFFDVQGGRLEMVDGASICDVYGKESRSANAITVSAGGEFMMSGTALIANCCNDYFNVNKPSDYGVGAGLLVDGENESGKPSVAYLRGGTIRDCYAVRGCAVYVCNGAEVHVSGAMRVEIDEPYHFNDFVVEDLSMLYLDDATSGIFNMADGVDRHYHDTNFIGRVVGDWKTNLVALTNSAVRFVHSTSGDFGTAVTNRVDANDVLLVWCGAVRDGQLYTNAEGKVYAPVADVDSLVPPPTPVFVPLPELPPTADETAVADALAESDLSDPSVAANIKTLDAYNDFRQWAQGVDGGVDAVVSSEKAGNSYKFGMTTLLTQADAPTVEIAEIETVADGLVVRVVVKDGEDPVQVASDAVAQMFEATNDMSDWTKKVDLTIGEDPVLNADNSITFTVKPAGDPSAVFIRLKY